MKYDVDYFIRKFEAIPEEKWCVAQSYLGDKRCALGHCGKHQDYLWTEEATALSHLLDGLVAQINDGDVYDYKQPTPKQRILAALYDLKKMQSPNYPDLTKQLAVLPEDKTETDLIKMKNPRIFT